MTGQPRSSSVFLPRSEFDSFLFTEIDEQGNMPLTVLSALARGNVDPWVEAAQLARLPLDAAAERLASLIGAGRQDEQHDLQPLAKRLVGLLPRRGPIKIPLPVTAASSTAAKAVPDIHAIVLSVLLLAGLVGGAWIMAGRRAAEADAQKPPASAMPASSAARPMAAQP
jgi:hypothetical protein